MISALLTFLGGTAMRLFLGHLFDFVTKWQDAKNEIVRLRLQGELDAAAHTRNLDAIRLQADLGVKVIEANTAAGVTLAEADAFVEAVRNTGRPTGIQWVDAWNSSIRPLLVEKAEARSHTHEAGPQWSACTHTILAARQWSRGDRRQTNAGSRTAGDRHDRSRPAMGAIRFNGVASR